MSKEADPVAEIEGLTQLALDLRWSWNHAADELWRRLDPKLWELTRNPWVILHTISRNTLRAALDDPAFCRQLDSLLQARREALAAPSWFQEQRISVPSDFLNVATRGLPASAAISEVLATRHLRDVLIRAIRTMSYDELRGLVLPAEVVVRVLSGLENE